MSTECTARTYRFDNLGRRQVVTDFSGGSITSLNRDSIDTPEQIERAAEQFALDISHEDLQQIIDLTRSEGSTNTAPAAIQEDH